MSLAKLRTIDESGVTFRSHLDGARLHLSPERSIEIQGLLGSRTSRWRSTNAHHFPRPRR